MNSKRFEGKAVVVTGSGRGIGREIALSFAEEGARLVINALTLAHVEKVVKEIKQRGGEAVGCACDVSVPENAKRLIETSVKSYGSINILVNNAGILLVKSIVETTPEEWDRVFAVNAKGSFLCSKYAAERMMKQGGGSIVNILTSHIHVPISLRGAYAASKAAVAMLTRIMAAELAKYGIRVNAVAPGPVMTNMIRERMKEGAMELEALQKRIPIGRLAEPSEIAHVVLFLASEEARYITGQVVVVDGGFTATL